MAFSFLPQRLSKEPVSEGSRGSGTPSTAAETPRSSRNFSFGSSKRPNSRSSSALSSQNSYCEDLSRSSSQLVVNESQHQTQRRRGSFHSFDAHAGWQTLLEFAGDTKEAWRERKVHRWLGVSESDALVLLQDLQDLKGSMDKEPREQQGSQPPLGFFSWLFGGWSQDAAVASPPPVQHQETASYSFDRLEDLGLLGHGGFGSVSLVRCSATGQVLALKAISKGTLVDMQLQHTPLVERDVMRASSSPFVLQLMATFNRGQWLYLLMEAAMGGDLYTAYSREGLFGSEVHARFFAACVLCAFQHLHERKIIYRDLKMENVVLDSRGYGKLCDFGTASFRFSGTRTMCGTPEYMAPEIIDGSMHCCAVDWWALGVLIYELITASTPFASEDPLEIFAQVKVGIDRVRLPWRTWSRLVQSLCRKEPGMRLPMLPGGIDNIKAHSWFTETCFSWCDFESQAQPAPYVPKLSGPTDMRNFSPGQQELPHVSECYDTFQRWWRDFEVTLGPARVAQAGARSRGAPA